jgi:S-adenosylmethionine synthetase
MKAQVSVIYEGVQAKAIDTIVVSAQHDPGLSHGEVAERVRERIIRPVLDEYRQYDQGGITEHINPTGLFVIGGPKGDTGLTGRKIIVDTYGGAAPHGGGAFSGKDPSKVDRSGAYAARWVAKSIVAANLATRVTVQISYAIGIANPISIAVDTSGTGVLPDEKIAELVERLFDLSPAGIIAALALNRPIYKLTSSLGHFGAFRQADACPWEETGMVELLGAAAGIETVATPGATK